MLFGNFYSSSPDSDDTYAGEESEDLSMRDDQFLVSDRNENKFYGSVHGGSTQATGGIKPRFSYISHRLQVHKPYQQQHLHISSKIYISFMKFGEDLQSLGRLAPF